MRFAFLAFTLTIAAAVVGAHTIKHVIVLMEENRSFDHLLGWRPGVDGLTEKDCNWVDPNWHSDGKFCVTKNASNIQKCDPDHDFVPTSIKIFGYEDAVKLKNFSDPTMSGFINFEKYRGETLEKNHYCEVMEMFDPKHLPVMNGMADEFLLFDKFFASLPGPTWPNRLFFLAGTSGGLTETSNPWFRDDTGRLYPLRTIYDQIKDAGLSWKNYVNDTPWELMVETVAHNPENVVLLEEFFKDAREGTLPNFAFINPRAGVNFTHGYGSNDQHPDHDVALGEQYYKDVYEALRASPQWNDTLFVLTYDEHGGFYDHVAPPNDVPPPDNYTSWPDNFTFNRGGIRIPTLLMSPWIPKGKVEGRPPAGAKPFDNSQYELTSIMATVRKIFNMTEGPLTKRDAWAATFEHLLSEPEPRTDCPMHLPDPMPPTIGYLREEADAPLNSLQKYIAKVHASAAGVPEPHHIDKQEHISAWLQKQFARHKAKTLKWKDSKLGAAGHKYDVRCEPYIGMSPKFVASNWSIPETAGLAYRTVSINIAEDHASEGQWYCLDAGNRTAGAEVSLSLCHNTNPQKNQDRSQQWVFAGDATLRPYHDQTLCVTNNCTAANPKTTLSTKVTLEKCGGTLNQHYGYQGAAPGNTGWYNGGMISQGDAIYALVIVPANAPGTTVDETKSSLEDVAKNLS